MNIKNLRSDCPINYALEIVGDKWTLLVIRDLVFEGKKFYKDFAESKEKVSTNILSDRLKRLEAEGIVQSEIYADNRTQKIYSLTQKGLDLIPILVELIIWSSKYEDHVNIYPGFVDKLVNQKELITKAITAHVGTTTFSAYQ